MQFNDTTGKSGLIQRCEKWTNLGDGAISGDAFLLAQFTTDINAAYDEILPLIFSSDAKWQWDDINHTKYPIATTDLVAGQPDYPFVADEQENSILEISKLFVMDPAGVYREMRAVDASTERGVAARILAQPSSDTGTPRQYDKLGPSVFLDPIPNYGQPKGVRAIFSRTPSYFTVEDTTKTPGIPVLHELLALIPSRDYVAIHKSDNAVLLATINAKIAAQKADLSSFLSRRSKDERTVIRAKVDSFR